jgi:hypothetical protein
VTGAQNTEKALGRFLAIVGETRATFEAVMQAFQMNA